MFVLSLEFPSPLAVLSVTNRICIIFFNYLFNFCKHFTILSCKNEKKKWNKGTRTTMASYPQLIHCTCFCIVKRTMIYQLADCDFSWLQADSARKVNRDMIH